MDEGPRRSAAPRNDQVISQERFDSYHSFARERGTSRVLYYLARALLVPAMLIWLRLQRSGREHARFSGGLIVASNHRSFLDPFVIGAFLPWRRRSRGRDGCSPGSAPSRSAAASRTRPRWRRPA
jgi:hypothetical protein